MKYSLALFIALMVVWLLWSGHFFEHPFLIALGVLSCAFCIYLSRKMNILDEEAVPAHLGIRPFTRYAPWLAKEIAVSNIEASSPSSQAI